MSELEILAVDPFDTEAFDAWHAAYLAAESAVGPGISSPWQLEEMRALAQDRGTLRRIEVYVGRVAGCVVTAGWVVAPQRDNISRAELLVGTVPTSRRRGYAAAMVRHLEQVARDGGRTILVGECSWTYAAGADGIGEAGPEFAAAVGFGLALGDVKRVLALPVPVSLLAEHATAAAAHHVDHRLQSWVGPVPDHLLEGWARLTGSLLTEAPTGELDVEPEYRDPAVIRENEAVLARQGRTKFNTVAIDAAGEVVAYTDLATTVHEPTKAYQWGTLVRGDARGHRLGLAVKVANLRLVQAERPDVTEVTTYNAEVNAHMIGVNERLGYRPVARLGEFQKRL